MVPTEGAAGVAGCALMTTFSDDNDIHPNELVTVKVYVPARSVEIVVVIPVPVFVTEPGVRTIVQVPVDGNPLKITLPVDNAQVGCVIVPTTGAVGVTGCKLITTLADDTDVHPAALVTVKVKMPEVRPETVVLVPVPFVVTAPGLRINVHVPVEGKPVNTTLPVAIAQVG